MSEQPESPERQSGSQPKARPPPPPASISDLVLPGRSSSFVWRLFRLHADPAHRHFAWCTSCSVWVPRTHASTQSMRLHLQRRHKKLYKEEREREEANKDSEDDSDDDDEDDNDEEDSKSAVAALTAATHSSTPSAPSPIPALPSSSFSPYAIPSLPSYSPPSTSSRSARTPSSLPPDEQVRLDDLLAETFIECNLSIHLLVSRPFRALLRGLNPRYALPTRSALVYRMECLEPVNSDDDGEDGDKKSRSAQHRKRKRKRTKRQPRPPAEQP